MFTGKSLFATADCDARQASVPARRSARFFAPGPRWFSDSSHFCASGLTVADGRITRVICAVPSASNAALFFSWQRLVAAQIPILAANTPAAAPILRREFTIPPSASNSQSNAPTLSVVSHSSTPYITHMSPLRARVANGRIVLDEPTTLRKGTVIDLVADDEGDDLTNEERQALHHALPASGESAEAGRLRPASELLDEL